MENQLLRSRMRWFTNCGGFTPHHDLGVLQRGIGEGKLNEQDEYGMTALSLAVMSNWQEGVESLLKAGADTELRYYRTGETALYMAVQSRHEPLVGALIAAGADPDAPNYWGLTPRRWASHFGVTYFDQTPLKDSALPPARIQNAEHLAEHHYPQFEIPKRAERETLRPGQAVDLYVYGPKESTKQDTVKVRIIATEGVRPDVVYHGEVETPLELTHLPAGMMKLTFRPESVACVYLPRPT